MPDTIARCQRAIETIAQQTQQYGPSAHRTRLMEEWLRRLAEAGGPRAKEKALRNLQLSANLDRRNAAGLQTYLNGITWEDADDNLHFTIIDEHGRLQS